VIRICIGFNADPDFAVYLNADFGHYITFPFFPFYVQVLQCCVSVTFWVQIRIRRSVPLTNGSGSGSYYFRLCPSKRQQKTIFSSFFCVLQFKGTVHHFSKIKSHKKSQKSREGIKVLLGDQIQCADFRQFEGAWIWIRIEYADLDPGELN
jgi:hypothetical protein